MSKITRSTYKRDTYYKKVAAAVTELLKEDGVVKPVDVFMKMGNLTNKQYEDWRFGRVRSLERVIAGSLSKIRRILKIVKCHAEACGLKPSPTVYKKWGKGRKHVLQFSKTGHPFIEELFSTHYVAKPRTPRPQREKEGKAC